MKTIRIVLKILPIIGDFVNEVKGQPDKDLSYWTATIADLVRTILTALGTIGVIENLPF